MVEPNREKVIAAIQSLGLAMGASEVDESDAAAILEHVLFNRELEGRKGRNGWKLLSRGIATERELRNLLMAIATTTISHWHDIQLPGEPNLSESKQLYLEFENALFGRPAKVHPFDFLDPWDSTEHIPHSMLIAVDEHQIAAIEAWWANLSEEQRTHFIKDATFCPGKFESLSIEIPDDGDKQNDWYEYVVNQDARFYFDCSNGQQTSHGFMVSPTLHAISSAAEVNLVSHLLTRKES